MQIKLYIQRFHLELLVWPIALVLLFFMDPQADTLCLFKRIGLPWCPGCGLGHGLHYLLHGQWAAAIHSHPLAPFALVMLLYRTVQLARLQLSTLKTPLI